MKVKSGIQNALRTTGYVISCLVFAILLVIAVSVLIRTCKLETSSRARINLHCYLAAGFVAFFAVFLIPRLRNNFRWLMKFMHEFTHLVFAILFFRKINRFKVDSEEIHMGNRQAKVYSLLDVDSVGLPGVLRPYVDMTVNNAVMPVDLMFEIDNIPEVDTVIYNQVEGRC